MLEDRDLLKLKAIIDKLRYEVRRFHHHTWGYLQLNLLGDTITRKEGFAQGAHPVLLLHGWVATRRVRSLLGRRLRRDGYSVFSVHLGGLFDTFNSDGIPRLADLVAAKVEKLRQRHDLGRISIVGHSEGGLIARYYIKRLRGNRNVRTLITLGTPHRGTVMAFAGIFLLGVLSRSIWQLTPLSPFIRELKKGPWPKDVKLVSIYSSCVLDEIPGEPVKNVEVENVSHAELLFSRAVYNAIQRELPPPNEPAETWKERTIYSPALQETLNLD